MKWKKPKRCFTNKLDIIKGYIMGQTSNATVYSNELKKDKKTVYLAGKISGDPRYREKFKAARNDLEHAGYAVLDTTVLPFPGLSYGAYMRIGEAMINESDAVCFLGDWVESNGAKIEHTFSKARKKVIFYFEDWRRYMGLDLKEGWKIAST